ncbi:coiled-coil domain-containing protein 78-like [Montipora foliosa]|uniref:coiled-coil domain-containing protein 78-like n=1 Tax=Montipora foliosa TaxID=591990 RepID=UPI0035F1D779
MNIEVLARVRPSKHGEQLSLNIAGTRIQAGDGTGHIFGSVYKPESLTHDIFRDAFSPLVELFIAGYNVCVLVFGETGSGKSYSLAGEKNSKAGLIPLIINSVFTRIKSERSSGRDVRVQRNDLNDGVVFVQFVEVYNEKLRDLLVLPHEDRHIDVAEDGQNGVHVQNATYKRVANAAECTSLFRQGWAIKTKPQTDFEPRAAVFFSLDLSMVPKDSQDPSTSRFLVVKLSGAEKLSEDPTQLRMREGPTMNRGIISFGTLVAKLAASPRSTRVVNYGESKVTMLLKDALGGNCKTKALITLNAVDTQSLPVVLKTAGQLAQVRNYPIVNDFFAKELMCQFRSKIVMLEDDLRISGGTSKVASMGSQSKALELTSQITQLTQENFQLQEKNEKMYTRLEEMQKRFSEVMNSKTQLSSKLISSEEEKLKISKTLVDVQLENNRLQEDAAAINFDLNNKVLALENNVMELQMYLDKAHSDLAGSKEQLGGMETEHKELVNEYIALKTSHVQLTADYQKEVTKNEELGLELVTLLNTKEKLQHDKEAVELEKMQEYYDQLRRITNKFSRSSLREKDDLSRSVLNLQSEKLELEKQLLHTSQQREGKVESLRVQHQRQLDKLEERISKMRKEVQETKEFYREAQRKLAQQSAELIAANGERHRLNEENNHLDLRLKELSTEYTNRLQQYIHDIASFCGQAAEKQQSVESLQSYLDVMVGQMKEAHDTREEDLESRIRELKRTVKDVTQKIENVSSAYRMLKYDLESNRGCGAPQADHVELHWPSDIELNMAQSREIAKLQSDLKELKQSNEDLKQKLARKIDEQHNELQSFSASQATVEMGWGYLRKQLREFTLNTQQDLESERASLLTRCILAEEQQARLQHYIDTNLKSYQEEIVRLRQLLGNANLVNGRR